MYSKRIVIALVAPLALMTACVSYQRPTEVTAQMARSEAIVQEAERAGAATTALPELQGARDKLADAKRALEKEDAKNDRIAMTLAKQAEVDARFATAKTRASKQIDTARKVEDGVDALRTEANRTTDTPASSSAQ